MQHFTNFAGKSRAGKRFSKQDESGFFPGAEWRDSAHEETGERRGGEAEPSRPVFELGNRLGPQSNAHYPFRDNYSYQNGTD